jgi:hypothetical protein
MPNKAANFENGQACRTLLNPRAGSSRPGRYAPIPKVAIYRGSGDANDAANFK